MHLILFNYGGEGALQWDPGTFIPVLVFFLAAGAHGRVAKPTYYLTAGDESDLF